MMKKILVLLLPVMLITGCQKKNTFKISGTVKEKSKDYIYLNKVNVNTLVFIDSSKITKSGKFNFKVKAAVPDFYQLGFSDSDFITILSQPGEKIKLDFKGKNLYQDYTVNGSEGSEQIKMLDLRLTEAKKKLDSLKVVYDIASKETDFNKKGPLIESEFNNILKDIRKKNIEFIITHTRSMASIKALYQKIDDNTYVLNESRDLQYLKIISDTLRRYYPDSRQVMALTEDLKKQMNQMYSRRLEDMVNTLPETKMDPNLKDINGNRIAFSSLRGKVVLLAFWSVESKECIAENLQLKDLYKLYHKKGFEIYQINLDEDEEIWKKEVKFDELPWINTREDDPLKPENARIFNVQVLPANYLYNKDGVIVGSNLHGKNLQIKLSQLFNN